MKRFAYSGGYGEYVEAQVSTTRRKARRGVQWATEADMAYLAWLVRMRRYRAVSVLCHGVRSGKEQRWLAAALAAEGVRNEVALGTDLVAPRGDALTLVHDFNKPSDVLVGRFDIVFSNAFDHAFDPEETIRVWAGQLAPRGRLIVEHHRHRHVSGTDPTGGTLPAYLELFRGAGLAVEDVPGYRAPGAVMKRYIVASLP